MKTQTRLNSAQRRSYVLSHTSNIQPGNNIPVSGPVVDVTDLRNKGARACSQIEAVLGRRSSFKVGTDNIIKA